MNKNRLLAYSQQQPIQDANHYPQWPAQESGLLDSRLTGSQTTTSGNNSGNHSMTPIITSPKWLDLDANWQLPYYPSISSLGPNRESQASPLTNHMGKEPCFQFNHLQLPQASLLWSGYAQSLAFVLLQSRLFSACFCLSLPQHTQVIDPLIVYGKPWINILR